jgi:hypothetical protein
MIHRPSRRLVLAGATAAAGCASFPASGRADQTVWTFDRFEAVGGETTTPEGGPTLIDSAWGPATLFDGVDDALFIERHPLAGAETWTIECLIRPDVGAFEQRFLHLAELATEPAEDAYSGTRILFEIRVGGAEWWLDAFARGPAYNHTLIFPERRHPVGRWFHVAQSFDGSMYRSYVDGVLQGEAPLAYAPQGPGRTSVGVRNNRVSWFNGAMREARFTPAALPPSRFSRPG